MQSKLSDTIVSLVFFLFILNANDLMSQNEISYNWESPNAWDGGNFSIPPWFAEDLNYYGHEVLHFHPDYYNYGNDGFWTYSFALIVNDTTVPSTMDIIEETQLYFIGLARVLGDFNNPNLAIEEILVKSTSDWIIKDSYLQQDFSLRAYDPWKTGKSIDLNVSVATRICLKKKHRVIVYSVSPKDRKNKIWLLLEMELKAFECN